MGAGLAGVSCAYKLQQHGIRADLYESRDRVGGRCWSARTFADGQVAEHGGEFVDTRHVQLRRLVAALGLQLDDLFPAYEDEGDVTGLLVLEGEQRDRHEVHAHFDVVIRRLMRDAKKVGPYRWGQAGPAAKAFDQRTMREWMDDNVPGGSGSLLGLSMDVGLTGFWGIDPEDTSAITLLDTYITPYPGGPADERYHIRGGNDQVPNMLADLLPAGALHLESPLEAMRQRSDGAYELDFGDVASPVVADHVVLCLPFTTLRDVDLTGAGFDAKRMRAIDELGMGTNAKVLLQFEDRFPTFGWNGLFDLDVPKTDSWDSALAEPGPGGLLTIFGREDRSWLPRGRAPCGGAGWCGRRRAEVPRHLLAGHAGLVQRALVAGLVGGRPVGEGLICSVPARAMDGLLRLHGASTGKRALRRRAHVDVQPGLSQRRCRDRLARGPRGAPRDGTAGALVDVSGLTREVPGERRSHEVAGCPRGPVPNHGSARRASSRAPLRRPPRSACRAAFA